MLRGPSGWHLLINYCDRCAEKNNYPVNEEKIKDYCKLCGFTGPVNEVRNEEIASYKGFNGTTWEGGGFKVSQLDPFPVAQKRELVHSTLTYKLLTEKCAIYFDKNIIVIANPKTGQQIQITF